MIDELLQQHRPAICPSMALDCALVEYSGPLNRTIADQYLDTVVANRGKLRLVDEDNYERHIVIYAPDCRVSTTRWMIAS